MTNDKYQGYLEPDKAFKEVIDFSQGVSHPSTYYLPNPVFEITHNMSIPQKERQHLFELNEYVDTTSQRADIAQRFCTGSTPDADFVDYEGGRWLRTTVDYWEAIKARNQFIDKLTEKYKL